MADEGDFLEALIASERILKWIDALRSPSSGATAKLHTLKYAMAQRNRKLCHLLRRKSRTTFDSIKLCTCHALQGDERSNSGQ